VQGSRIFFQQPSFRPAWFQVPYLGDQSLRSKRLASELRLDPRKVLQRPPPGTPAARRDVVRRAGGTEEAS